MEENIPNYYAVIPAPVLYDESLVADAKLMYGEITGLCHVKGYCWATDSYFSNLHKVDIRTVQRWLKSLETKKYIKREVVYGDPQRPKYITERRIYITAPDVQTYRHACLYPMDTNVQQPIDTGVLDNIIEDNTISNNGIYGTTKSNERKEVLDPSHSLIKNNIDIDKGAQRRRPPNIQIIPTKEEVRKYFNKKGFKSNPDDFYDWYEAGDWKNDNGSFIRWKQKAISWEKREYKDKESRRKRYTNIPQTEVTMEYAGEHNEL